MAKRIAILHYATPPTIGGVESVILHQARGLLDQGYQVRIITGKGTAFDPRLEMVMNPLFGSSHPDILQVKKELDSGVVSTAYHPLVERLTTLLSDALSDCDGYIAHNIVTMHKNLPFTAALAALSSSLPVPLIAWCHDFAWINPQYLPEKHPGHPWDLLSRPWPNTRYVTVSEYRRADLAQLLGTPPKTIEVIPGGVDPARFFRWTQTTVDLAGRLGLLDADELLLLPARLTRRKNIALALHVLAELRAQSTLDLRLIVTGPPGPHNPSNQAYLNDLLALRQSLGLENAAHFLYACGKDDEPLLLDDDTTADLYRLCDALFFPSIEEGFGIPVLEAGLSGLPVFCADIPPMRGTGGDDAVYFDPLHDAPSEIAARVLQTLNSYPPFRLRVRVRHTFRWEVIIRELTLPLLEAQ